MCYLHVKNKKKIHFLALLTSFLLFGKNLRWGPRWQPCLVTLQASSNAATHKPPPNLILLIRSKAFHWKQNRFEILQHTKNPRDRDSINPSPLEPWWGYDFSCTSEGIKSDQRVWKTSRWKSVSKAWAYVTKSHSTGTQYRQLRRST